MRPPQLHRPAATGSAVKVSHLHSNHRASWRTHDLRHSTATLLLEQGVELVVIKEQLGHAHIGVTATVYAHVRLRLQCDAIDLLSRTLGKPPRPPPIPTTATTRHFVQHPSADVAVNYCRQDATKPFRNQLRKGFCVKRVRTPEEQALNGDQCLPLS
ncbi:tyrosine-type recombinase/integrase [Streptomyces sp. 1331.2]|uniref:tyrosine-type recombinase/integrase n=1 Tax=Streptomyces sp. 1331.2 TaxID=1938835 RepID=UPI00359C6BE5